MTSSYSRVIQAFLCSFLRRTHLFIHCRTLPEFQITVIMLVRNVHSYQNLTNYTEAIGSAFFSLFFFNISISTGLKVVVECGFPF